MNKPQHTPSPTDVEYLQVIRRNVTELMKKAGSGYAGRPGKLLDIAPQEHEGARPFFPAHVSVETLDIDPKSGCTHIADICKHTGIPSGTYDYVCCTEVLEHTLQPFDAVAEIQRLLKKDGLLFLSVPFNFRIHGPLPDCWRFTEHGLRALLKDFHILELNETPSDRPLMPIHYTVIARLK